jgi:nitrite reductase/ring-hydroxylating ferredoxin subunit
MFARRDLLRYGSLALGGLCGLVLAIPGAAFLLTPMAAARKRDGSFTPLARFADLKVGVPEVFPVIKERRDAWVRYPPEPVGLVWLVRQPDESPTPVLALSAECPHLACAISLSADGKEFFCPCHTSNFNFQGERLNGVSPRGMDPLAVEPFDPKDPDAVVRVKYQRFRTMAEKRVPLA